MVRIIARSQYTVRSMRLGNKTVFYVLDRINHRPASDKRHNASILANNELLDLVHASTSASVAS